MWFWLSPAHFGPARIQLEPQTDKRKAKHQPTASHIRRTRQLRTTNKRLYTKNVSARILRSYFMNSFGSYFEYKICEYAKNIQILEYNNTTSTTNLGAHNSNCFTMFDPRTRSSHPFMSGAPGAAVSFTWDATPDQPCLFAQLASSSDVERVFSTMNDSYHGRSWGTCLP